MSTYRLQKLFCPRSVAIVGASPRERSLGRSIARNLRAGGFGGSLHIVNPNYEYIDGLSTVNSVEAIAEVPDIVVIAAPPAAVPEIVTAAGAKGAAQHGLHEPGRHRRTLAQHRTASGAEPRRRA
jgi:acetyltransferase